MVTVNYYTKDIFDNDLFVTAITDASENSIRKAFKAIKKYNGTVFIDLNDNIQVRYYFENYYNDNATLNKTILSHVDRFIPDSDTSVLIDYNTALKNELKAVRSC